MWIVRLALRRPFTFLVMAVLVAILGVTSVVVMPTDAATEMLAGLAPGDKLVVSPNHDVRDGVRVRGTQTKANLDAQGGTPAQQKQSANTEHLQPEPVTQEPSQTNKKRGPGF
jgi:hypothetical protein